MYFSAAASSENDQGSMNFEHRPGGFNPAVQRRRHPAQCRVPDLALNIGKNLTGIDLKPASVQVLSRNTKLDDQITPQVLGLDLAALFAPKPGQGRLVGTHNDAGVRAAYEVTVEFLGVR